MFSPLQYGKKSPKKGEVTVAGSTLELASQVFLSDKVALNPKYQESLAHYRAAVQSLNMSDTAHVAGTVNKWINSATHGLVPSLLEEGEVHASRCAPAPRRDRRLLFKLKTFDNLRVCLPT